jgi:hypothetical protein
MPSPFTLCIVVLVTLALLGLPIGLSMIGASIFYLLIAGLDLGTAAEQLLNGLYNGYVLLAVPLFILAADLMNTGSRPIACWFCLVLVRFRGGLRRQRRADVTAEEVRSRGGATGLRGARCRSRWCCSRRMAQRTRARSPHLLPLSGRSFRRRYRWSSMR